MAKKVAIGIQNFEKIVTNGYFYVDKTDFIREWWESGDDVTLITRPRCRPLPDIRNQKNRRNMTGYFSRHIPAILFY